MRQRIAVAMSGGVDSSAAAALLVEQGYDVFGITMKTHQIDNAVPEKAGSSSCCSFSGINDARMVAAQLGIPHHLVDVTAMFAEEVINDFVSEYLRGRTPNPCVGCNRKMTYYFGARTTKDLYLTEYMQHFESVCEDFQYVPVLSHAEPSENWQGRTGFVMPYFKERIENPKNTEAYLCGSPGMINAVTKALIEMGVPKDKIYYDSFG